MRRVQGFAVTRVVHAVIATTLALTAGSLGCVAGVAYASPPLVQGLSTTASQAATPTTAPGQRAHCRGALTLPTRTNTTLIDTAIVCLIDRERARYRLAGLTPNHDLQGIASKLSREMAASGNFGDDSTSGETPWQRIASSPYAFGARTLYAAQNIGWGIAGLATPEGMISEWMHSAPHRQIVLTSTYRNIGAGVAPRAPFGMTRQKPGATYTIELAARG